MTDSLTAPEPKPEGETARMCAAAETFHESALIEHDAASLTGHQHLIEAARLKCVDTMEAMLDARQRLAKHEWDF